MKVLQVVLASIELWFADGVFRNALTVAMTCAGLAYLSFGMSATPTNSPSIAPQILSTSYVPPMPQTAPVQPATSRASPPLSPVAAGVKPVGPLQPDKYPKPSKKNDNSIPTITREQAEEGLLKPLRPLSE